MLFPYKYVPHTIEKLQEYIDHLFLEVWCEAEDDFDVEKLHPELKEIVLEIFLDDTIKKDHLYGPIEEIYNLFLPMKKGRREALKKWYANNNDIEKLCRGDNHCKPIHYAQLKKICKDISPKIETFFKSLFTDAIHLKSVWSRIGHIDEHYKAFMTINDEGSCPFCGINNVKGPYHTRREAYDHFLPKAFYPFNAINFHNLAPMCHECNSSYKTVKDPLYNSGKRRKALYPYAVSMPPVDVKIDLKMKNINGLTPEDIELKVTSGTDQEEVDSWMDVFGIEERYKAACLAKNQGKAWYSGAIEGYERAKVSLGPGFTKESWVRYCITEAQYEPFADGNLIKAAFLEGCQRAEIL